MGFWKSLTAVGKSLGGTVPGVGPALDLAEEGIQAHQKRKRDKRARRLAALSAVAATFKNPIVLAVLVLSVLAFLFFAPPEAKKALMELMKFFTG